MALIKAKKYTCLPTLNELKKTSSKYIFGISLNWSYVVGCGGFDTSVSNCLESSLYHPAVKKFFTHVMEPEGSLLYS
jgi:hypothetical protein